MRGLGEERRIELLLEPTSEPEPGTNPHPQGTIEQVLPRWPSHEKPTLHLWWLRWSLTTERFLLLCAFRAEKSRITNVDSLYGSEKLDRES